MNKKTLFLNGLKDGFSIFLGYFAVSFTFGISAVKSGIAPFQAILISASNLTSAGQFAALSIIESSLSYFEMAATQLVINLRYFLMSSALSQKFDEKMNSLHRFFIAFGNTDEIFALCSVYKGNLPPAYCYGLFADAIPGWVLGTALGAFVGDVLPPRLLSAFGIALYGMFIAIILPEARRTPFVSFVIFISMSLSALFVYAPVLKTISSGFRIIILAIVISSIAAIIRPIEESQEERCEDEG